MRHLLSRCVSLAALAFFFNPGPACAKGIILITRGETINEVGKITNPGQLQLGGTVSVGYKYSYFGVFWLDLWTWGGEYCVYDGDRYAPIQPAQAAELLGKPERSLGAPFLYRAVVLVENDIFRLRKNRGRAEKLLEIAKKARIHSFRLLIGC